MDWTSYQLEKLKLFEEFNNETYLITLGNKGLYKRSLKDLLLVSKTQLIVEQEEIIVRMDDISVHLSENPVNSRCTCPSRGICKHVLMAIMSIGKALGNSEKMSEVVKEFEDINEPEHYEKNNQHDYELLANISEKDLLKTVGSKTYKQALNLVLRGHGAKLYYEEFLEAHCFMDGTIVCFPKTNALNGAICKCGSKELCLHKLVGILSYKQDKKCLNELIEVKGLEKKEEVIIQEVEEIVSHIFAKGIITVNKATIIYIGQLVLRTQSLGLVRLARLLKKVETQLNYMKENHIAFSIEEISTTLLKIYNDCFQLKRLKDDYKTLALLKGKNRSQYYTMEPLKLVGLGAYPWETQSGFRGVTACLFNQKTSRFFTMNCTRLTKTDGNGTEVNLLRQSLEWKTNISLEELSTHQCKILKGKANEQGRLSASKETQCHIDMRINRSYFENNLLPIYFTEFKDAFESVKGERDYFINNLDENIAVMKVKKLNDLNYDEVNQQLTLYLEDEKGDWLQANVLYKDYSKRAIRYLESLDQEDYNDSIWTMRIWKRGQKPVVQLLGHVLESGVKNIYFA